MKLINKTRYSTRALRKIVLAGIKANGLEPKWYRVEVVSGRRRAGCTGLASYHHPWVRMRVPVSGFDVGSFARVLDHELAHNRGLRHEEMDPNTLWCSGPCPEWALGFKPEDFERPTPPKLPRAERMAQLVQQRERKARSMLEKWEKAEKRAHRHAAKWRAVVKGYERRAAGKEGAGKL